MPVPVTMRRFTNPNLAAFQPAPTPDKDICQGNNGVIAILRFQMLVRKQICHPERSEAKDLRLHDRPSHQSLTGTRAPYVMLPVSFFWSSGIALLLGLATLQLPAQTTTPKPPPLTVDRDPVRSP